MKESLLVIHPRMIIVRELYCKEKGGIVQRDSKIKDYLSSNTLCFCV